MATATATIVPKTLEEASKLTKTQLITIATELGCTSISRLPKISIIHLILDKTEVGLIDDETRNSYPANVEGSTQFLFEAITGESPLDDALTPKEAYVRDAMEEGLSKAIAEKQWKLKQELNSDLPAEEVSGRVKRDLDVFISDKHRAILDNSDLSKSEKMRRLWKKDMSIADIHRVLETHYSFTYGVIDRYRKILDN